MSAYKDITGQRFGKLVTVRGTTYRDKGGRTRCRWDCICDCGGRRTVNRDKLREGRVTDCGKCATRPVVHGFTTGGARPSEYNIWIAMRQRCHNPNSFSYARYGALGIKVCARWDESFTAFFADMGRRPTTGHSIDRINPFGDYEPGNCRWATASEQALNRRANTKFPTRRIET